MSTKVIMSDKEIVLLRDAMRAAVKYVNELIEKETDEKKKTYFKNMSTEFKKLELAFHNQYCQIPNIDKLVNDLKKELFRPIIETVEKVAEQVAEICTKEGIVGTLKTEDEKQVSEESIKEQTEEEPVVEEPKEPTFQESVEQAIEKLRSFGSAEKPNLTAEDFAEDIY